MMCIAVYDDVVCVYSPSALRILRHIGRVLQEREARTGGEVRLLAIRWTVFIVLGIASIARESFSRQLVRLLHPHRR